MIRVAVFLAATAGFAFVAAWLADRPGEVVITWLGYHADTSVAVLIGAAAAFACVTVFAWSLLRALMRAPRGIAGHLRHRRAVRGQHAIARGLVAIGAGDARGARRFAAEAARLVGPEPLLLLLQAQTAQLTGERDGADAAFRAMAERHDTKLLGLRGLFIEARRRNDAVAARAFAEEAAKAAPSLAWAGQAALEFRCMNGDWPGALEALERNRNGGLVDKATFRRQRAVLLTARALGLMDADRSAARELAVEAVKLSPELVPAAALAGRLLAESGDRRRAGRLIEVAWRANPHPDLAGAFADVVPGSSARDRLMRMRALRRLAEGNPESALAVARAALEAREFAEAREALKPLLAAPTRRVLTLMAQLEEAERGDIGRAREWMARAVTAAHDPAWTADGFVAETWMPVSPVTGRLDAFQWRVPVADLTPRGPVIDEIEPEPLPPPAITIDAAPERAAPVPGGAPDRPPKVIPIPPPEDAPDASPRKAAPPIEPSRPKTETPPLLVHAPDDPGPEAAPRRSRDMTGILRSWLGRGAAQ
jgi:HemY protein